MDVLPNVANFPCRRVVTDSKERRWVMSEVSDGDLRKRLFEIQVELDALPGDAFAARHKLSSEADGLRATLEESMASEVEDRRREWADRAGRKGSHEEDPELAKLRIVSPNESGGIGV